MISDLIGLGYRELCFNMFAKVFNEMTDVADHILPKNMTDNASSAIEMFTEMTDNALDVCPSRSSKNKEEGCGAYLYVWKLHHDDKSGNL